MNIRKLIREVIENKVPRDLDVDMGVYFGDYNKQTGDIIVAHSTSSNLLPAIYKNGLEIGSESVWDNSSGGKLFFEIEPTRTHYGENVYGWKATQKYGGVLDDSTEEKASAQPIVMQESHSVMDELKQKMKQIAAQKKSVPQIDETTEDTSQTVRVNPFEGILQSSQPGEDKEVTDSSKGIMDFRGVLKPKSTSETELKKDETEEKEDGIAESSVSDLVKDDTAKTNVPTMTEEKSAGLDESKPSVDTKLFLAP